MSREKGHMKDLLSATGPLKIVGRVSHCQSPQVTDPPEIAGTATVNLCRSKNLQRQLAQPLPTSAGQTTFRDRWHSQCQPLQV